MTGRTLTELELLFYHLLIGSFIPSTEAAMDFTTVPVLDLSLAESPETEPQFLSELRNALVQVGFFYLKNHSIPESVQRDAIQQAMELFDLPLDKKLEMETVKSKHFLGYNRMASEKTAAEIDYNESIAVSMVESYSISCRLISVACSRPSSPRPQ